NYLSLVELAKNLNKKAGKLEKGKLNLKEISEMLDNSRDIYERLTILRYKALVEKTEQPQVSTAPKKEAKEEIKKVTQVEEASFSFNFEPEKELGVEISPNQKNLLDEIHEIGGDGIETKSSVNEQYASTPDKTESLAEKLTKSKIVDLKKGMGLNQRFLFTNDLFSGDKEAFENTIDKLNACDTVIEAKAYLSSEIENSFEWDLESDTVAQFIALLERKFI
ncbi:MAG: hypothetical protein ABF258_07945, partial [Flavobacteriales bacterium]